MHLSATSNAGGDSKHVVEDKPLDDELPWVCADAVLHCDSRNTEKERNLSQTKGNHNVLAANLTNLKFERRLKEHEPCV